MRPTKWIAWTIVAMMLGMLGSGVIGRPGETRPPARAAQTAWAPKLYGFCMEMSDARRRTIAQQARMLKELGYAGIG